MKAIQEWLGHSNYAITANLYSHLEYNAKVISLETIARMLDGEALEQNKASADTAEPEKKSTRKKSAAKKPKAKTTDKPEPKKTNRKKEKQSPCRYSRIANIKSIKYNIEKWIVRKRKRKLDDFSRKKSVFDNIFI